MAGYAVELSPGLEEEYSSYLETLDTGADLLSQELVSTNTSANIAILGVLLVLGLTSNLLAFPVILFRRTRCFPPLESPPAQVR